MFFLFCFYLSFRKDKIRVRLVFELSAISPLYGCLAEQVNFISSKYDNTNCATLKNELEIDQERLQKLESIDTTERDIRNFLLGVGVFSLHLLELSTPPYF
jgi:hypothetical protein